MLPTRRLFWQGFLMSAGALSGANRPKLFGTTTIARLMIRSSAVFGNSSLKSYQTLRNDERDTRRRRPIAGSCRTMYSLSSPHTTEECPHAIGAQPRRDEMVLIQSTMTGTPIRSHFAMVRKSEWSTSSASKPKRCAAFTRFEPVVPVLELVRHALAICLSETSFPKNLKTIFRHAGPHIALLCLKLPVAS